MHPSPASPFVVDALKPLLETRRDLVTVIGIDGPTAAGKTMLAAALAEKLREHGRVTWTFQLDWTLAARPARREDLKHLRERDALLPYEGELHMRLGLVRDFLEQVAKFNELRDRHPEGVVNLENEPLKLEGLYSRESGGQTTGSALCHLQPGMVVILEGHYTLRSRLDDLIDLNVLLLSSPKELLQRKVARVAGYRDVDEATDYFRRVDLPSFEHHLRRFGFNADLIIENTDVAQPRASAPTALGDWLEAAQGAARELAAPTPGKTPPTRGADRRGGLRLPDDVFSESSLVGPRLKQAVGLAITAISEWDQRAGQAMRAGAERTESDLLTDIRRLARRLKVECAPFRVELCYANDLYKLYHRSFPLSIGLRLEGDSPVCPVNIFADVHEQYLALSLIWAGGCRRYEVKRGLGALEDEGTPKLVETKVAVDVPTGDQFLALTPAPFTVPSFLRTSKPELVLTGREQDNVSATYAMVRLLERGGVWVHRFAKFSELRVFSLALQHAGAKTVVVGNYLIAVRQCHPALRRDFEEFRRAWSLPLTETLDALQDQDEFDAIVDREREGIAHFVQVHCPDFACVDGLLFCRVPLSQASPARERVAAQLRLMLAAENRSVRKRTVQFLLDQQPNLLLPTARLWSDLPAGSEGRISLETFTRLGPSILAELYLWLALRGERSAVLGANVYDIRGASADARAHLLAAVERRSAVVLQCSFNALGQKELADGAELWGYLRPEQGAADFVKAGLNAARDLVLDPSWGHRPVPLFGLGLDHVGTGQDRPAGRARRFLHHALGTGLVTHLVLDGSHLCAAADRGRAAMREAFDRVASYGIGLVGNDPRSHIYDYEICATELNYIDGEQGAIVPTPDDLLAFAVSCRALRRQVRLGFLNARPNLFIGNLGTTHHGFDVRPPAVEQAVGWRERLKSLNFVSAVLHGTTQSHPDVLARAADGCHKINVAGDFLRTLVGGLPARLQQRLPAELSKAKTQLWSLRGQMDAMSRQEVQHLQTSVAGHSRAVMDNIQSPQLTPLDAEYFRYKPYRFEPHQVDAVLAAFFESCTTTLGGRSKRSVRPGRFSASLIEVPMGEAYAQLVRRLAKEGVRDFHIDVGDGRFISRTFSALDKVEFLRKELGAVQLHAHLMVEDPHLPLGSTPSPIEQYVRAGCQAVAIHERSLTRPHELGQALEQIRALGARAGLVIETSERMDVALQRIIEHELDWVVVMGVPVGYGGQVFDRSTLDRLAAIANLSQALAEPLLIEVDGGLTLDNLAHCHAAGAALFAGWSIIRSQSLDDTARKYEQVKAVLAGSS